MVKIRVEDECGNLFVPNAFSPNGDEVNDILYVSNDCIKEIVFRIYDRWGRKVFESTDIKQGWDGRFESRKMNSAVFAYYLQATLRNGEKKTKEGNISLIK